MATLAKDEMRTYELGNVNEHPVIANDIIFEGAAVGLEGASNARPLALSDEFAGFAERKVDNTGGAVGAKSIRVKVSGLIMLSVTGAGATSVGEAVYATDDDTFTLTKVINAVRIGRVYRHISGTNVVVEFKATTLELSIADATDLATALVAVNAIIDRLEAAGIILPA